MKDKNVHEEIMQVLVEACDCTVEEMNCENSEIAIRNICRDVFNGKWEMLIQFSMKNLTMEQFNKIKKITLGYDYNDYINQFYQNGINNLFKLLAEYKGMIVSSSSLKSEEINQARASGRMYIDENSLGYVWIPDSDITNFPDTIERVKLFERWYPLNIEMPDSLKNWTPFKNNDLDK